MLSSPLVRRLLLIYGGLGAASILVMTIVGLSIPSTPAVSSLRWSVFVTEFVLWLIGFPIMAHLTNRWMAPIAQLKRASDQLSDGHRPDRVTTEHDDELGQLVQAFNELAQKVEARVDRLKQSQQQVASDNEQLATVLESMVEGVLAVNRDEQILLANMTAVRLLDLKAQNVVGQRVWEAIRIPQIQSLITKTLADEGQGRLEFAVPWTYSTVSVVASRLPGTPCPGVVLVLHDVSELRRLENLRRDFVSNVSHELKTPLAAITAYADTLLNGALEDPDVSRTFVDRISEQTERLNSLILDLLELARIESGEHVFHLDVFDLNQVLQSSVDAYQAIAESKQLGLEAQLFESELLVRADPEGVRTIVDNLIGNAINYTKPGGSIVVRSRRADRWIEFDIEDDGVGIAKEFQSRIFERFFRVDRARSRAVGGTGLGLSIVKHLCQQFGGNIKVKSQLGQGSTFTVNLPIAA